MSPDVIDRVPNLQGAGPGIRNWPWPSATGSAGRS